MLRRGRPVDPWVGALPVSMLVVSLASAKVFAAESVGVREGSAAREVRPDVQRAPTTLREGSWFLGARAGWAQARNLRGEPAPWEAFDASGLFPEVGVGITDRLMVSLTRLGVAYRFGERGGVEFVPALRTGFRVSLSERLGRGVVFFPVLTGDARFWLGDETAVTLGVAIGSRLGHKGPGDCEFYPDDCAPADYLLDQIAASGTLGLTHTFGQRVTLTPSVGVSTFVADAEFGDPWFTAFGRVNRGVWSDPVVRLHVAPWFALDLDASLAYRPSDERFGSFVGGGVMFNW